jgi:2-keto-4-pentenoate hydratase
MSLDPMTIAEAAAMLREAQASGNLIAPLRDTFPGLDTDDAYAIQKINTGLKLAAGARLIGAKIGLTSPAVQKQLGVDTPDYGVLFDDMGFAEGLPIPLANLQQPKIEAEVAFVLGRDLDMQNPTIIDVIGAIDYVLPALEIVGSRIAGWNIRLVDTVADNASSSAWVIGAMPKKLGELDLRGCAMTMTRDGVVVSSGSGAECLGHPLNAVLWLARTMARVGAPLRAGHLVLSGALGPMVAVEAGKTYTASIGGLGSVTAVFE